MSFISVRSAPSILGPFRLLKPLGQGGFAPVWLAEETYGGRKLRDVALKLFILPAEIQASSVEANKWRDDVINEARALCRVEHPNVVRFYSLHSDEPGEIVGLAMEYVAGANLDTMLREYGPLEERDVLEAGICVAWALASVHQAGLVHRDVKPGNIIKSTSGYKLIDFGIVVEAQSQSADGLKSIPPPIVGTAGYVAPECLWFAAPPTAASDLYALGATLHRLTTGVLPQVPNVPVSGVGRRGSENINEIKTLADLVRILLAPDPTNRPRHADWVARELERLRNQRFPQAKAQEQASSEVMVTLQQRPGAGTERTLQLVVNTGEIWGDPPLIGRAAEVLALSSASRGARDQSEPGSHVTLITGPLGIGRTSVLQAAIVGAGAAPERVLQLRCSPERRSPFRPLLRALEALPDGGDGAFALLREALDRALAPNFLLEAREGDQALEGVEDALLDAARDELVVLAIDDIQWGDAHTLGLLKMLIERHHHGYWPKLCVYATARDEPHPSAGLRSVLGLVRSKVRPGVKHVALRPLTADAVAKIGQSIGPLDEEVERAIVRGSGGIPFFIVHALRAWKDTGALVWRNGAWRAADLRLIQGDVPGVASLVEAQMAAYFQPNGPEWNAAYRAFATIGLYGGGIPVEMVFRLVGEDEAALERALEVLVDAGIITVGRDGHEYGFGQEMVRQAVLNVIRSKPWFHRLHRKMLDLIAEEPTTADAAFLATGYEKLGLRPQARTWLERAMAGAIQTGLFSEAAEFGDRLIGLVERPEERVDVALEVVRALILGRQLDGVKDRLLQVEALERIAACPRLLAQQVKRRIYRLEAVRWLHESADDATLIIDADELGDAVLSCKARMAVAGVSKGKRAIAIATEAVTIAEGLDPALEYGARILRVDLNYTTNPRDLELEERDLQRALVIAKATSSQWKQILVEGDLAVREADLGRVSDAINRFHRLIDQAQALGMREQQRLFSNNLSMCLMRAGRAKEAAVAAGQTAKLAQEAGDPMLQGVGLSQMAYALCVAGHPEKALAHAQEAELLQRERNDRMRVQTLLRLAEIHYALGKMDVAHETALVARKAAQEHSDHGSIAIATLWDVLYRAQQGQTNADQVSEAIADVERSGVAQRALARVIIDRAKAWLSAQLETLE